MRFFFPHRNCTTTKFTMCFGGREDVEAKRSREIDALIHRDEKVMQKVVKLLLLGMHLGCQLQYQSTYG
jgi:hypothetical protein